MLEKSIVIMLMRLAAGLSGYDVLPDSELPQFLFVPKAELVVLACEGVQDDRMEICLSQVQKVQGLFDRRHHIVYMNENLEQKLRAGVPYEKSIGIHELVHALQMYWKHHNNPDITAEEYMEDEQEAYSAQFRMLSY